MFDQNNTNMVGIQSSEMLKMCEFILSHESELIEKNRVRDINDARIPTNTKISPKIKILGFVLSWNYSTSEETFEQAEARLRKIAKDEPEYVNFYYVKREPNGSQSYIHDIADMGIGSFGFPIDEHSYYARGQNPFHSNWYGYPEIVTLAKKYIQSCNVTTNILYLEINDYNSFMKQYNVVKKLFP